MQHYSLDLDYLRAGNRLTATAVITAVATHSLSRFDLDLLGFTVTGLTVNGAAAAFRRDGQELIITPRQPIRAGRTFVVRVDYRGSPRAIKDVDGAAAGWTLTKDGAFVAGEPQVAATWFPANDHPRDKATFDIAMTVPKGITAVGNGRLISRRDHGATTTWHWAEDSPMATYLATITNGIFQLRVRHTPNGLPVYDAVDPTANPRESFKVMDDEPEVISFFSELFGPYPFSSVGGIVDDAAVPYALETQTKPVYPSSLEDDKETLVHELAHQWFGDSVSLRTWPDTWLNEGFATFSEWIYDERHGGRTAKQWFDRYYKSLPSDWWSPAPAALNSPKGMFDGPVYVRGGMTLQALRAKVGDRAFFGTLRAWCARYHHGNATTADFIALAEHHSGQQLHNFFHTWLYTPSKPEDW